MCYTKEYLVLSVIYKTSKMIDFCNCCNKCSSSRQLSVPSYSFPKKLLVAISLLVIITMFVTPSEARALEKRRHRRFENMSQTKDSLRHIELHRRRHHRRLDNLVAPTKEHRRKNSQAEIFNNQSRKILNMIKNTKSFFKEDQRRLKELKRYSEKVPEWLPSVNFVEIHFHDYSANKSRKEGTTIPERKFKYMIPKLYKSLVEYEELFKQFVKVQLDFPDTPTNSYKKKRMHLLQVTLQRLYSTIQEVNDSMTAVNMTVPPLKNKLDLNTLEMKVDTTQCLRNDYLAFRGYGNLLNNWSLEFRCPRKGKRAAKKICKEYEEKLKEKLNRKDQRINALRNRIRVTT